jgi:ABC-2 type transport system ATP-binding protein
VSAAGARRSTAGAPPTQLSAHKIVKRFGDREALRGVSLQTNPGELLAVIGPNGAGKTTLLSILAGVQSPTSGELDRGRGDVGWVPQRPAVYSKLSVAENLRLFANLERLPDPERAVQRMLEQTDLRERAGEQLGRLSGGNRQRVNIAIGLLAEPAVLLLDEPSSSLDPLQRERLWQFIGALAGRGTSVVFSTHNVSEAQRYAQRVLVLAEGDLLFNGSPSELAAQVGAAELDFEGAFVEFLRARGHAREAGGPYQRPVTGRGIVASDPGLDVADGGLDADAS